VLVDRIVIREAQSQLFEQKKNDVRHIVEADAGVVAESSRAQQLAK